MPQFTFGQVEAILAHLNRIASDKRVAFGSRLKHLQRQGIAGEDAQPGRGKTATYDFNELMKMTLGVELLQTGLPPQLAAKLVTGSWSLLQFSVYSATMSDEEIEQWLEMPFGPETREWLWVLNPEVLRDLSAIGMGEYDHMEAISAVPLEEVQLHIQYGTTVGIFGESWRTLVLNGTAITKAVIQTIEGFGYAKVADLRTAIQESMGMLSRSAREFFEILNGPVDVDKANRDQALAQAERALKSATTRGRFYPGEKVAERQARRAIEFLAPALVARLQQGLFGGNDIADHRAQTHLMRLGLLAPTMNEGELGFELTGIGTAAQAFVRDVEVPPDAIEADRAAARKEIDDQVQARMEALLTNDPDYPEDDARRVAEHGGPIVSFEEGQRREERVRLGFARLQREHAEDMLAGLSKDAVRFLQCLPSPHDDKLVEADQAVLRELVDAGVYFIEGEGDDVQMRLSKTGEKAAELARQRVGDGDVY